MGISLLSYAYGIWQKFQVSKSIISKSYSSLITVSLGPEIPRSYQKIGKGSRCHNCM